ncbi:MAG TPA: inorganic phosphate transporter [Humisphaera sp.]|jgi:PiT family inorganic phosphate transporter|nr:inorganic phosphate transporter [Humisphaera sp.]
MNFALPVILGAATAPAPQAALSLVIFIIIVALFFDFLNGFHDAANSIATVVSTRVLSPSQAVVWAAIFNFAAAFFFGTKVAGTISGKLLDTTQLAGDVNVVLAGLTGAIIWNIITWLLALPTSSSHALISGYAGAAIAKVGFTVIKPEGWKPVLLWLILSPLVGFLLGGLNMIAVSWIFRRSTPMRVDGLFRRLQLFSAGVYSLGHGGNDAQKTMGIIVAMLIAAGRGQYATSKHRILWHEHEIALWIILACQAAIALGTMAGGWRIVKTMGSGITRLTPVGGFCAELAAATTIFAATFGGVPISTTHAITGSILGVGTTRGVRSVRWIWGQRIITAWILTLPCSAFVAGIAYLVIHGIAVATSH